MADVAGAQRGASGGAQRRPHVRNGPPRLPRAQRREQILGAAASAFARGGYEATSLEVVAREARVSRVILYRHFESKAALYRAVLESSKANLTAAVGTADFTMESLDALLHAAARDPAGFRLLFRHAAAEGEFTGEIAGFRRAMVAVAGRELAPVVPDVRWASWAAQLAPAVAIESILAWLDAGQPDPERAARRVRRVVAAVVEAAALGTGSAS